MLGKGYGSIREGNTIEWRGIVISRWRGGYHIHLCGFQFQIQIQIQTQGCYNTSMHTELNCVFDAAKWVRRRKRRRKRSDYRSSRRGRRRTHREETICTDLAKRLITWTSPSASVPASSIPFSSAIFSAKIVSLMLLLLFSFYAQRFFSNNSKHCIFLLLSFSCAADIVFDYRQKVTRSFEYLRGDYYIAPLFMVISYSFNFLHTLAFFTFLSLPFFHRTKWVSTLKMDPSEETLLITHFGAVGEL